MVIVGFVGFVSVRNYLDQAAASAAQEAPATQ
jgi:energy-converting hydrogenase Eha subunit C